MKAFLSVLNYFVASLLVGTLYGGVAGAAFGTCFAPGLGTMFGFFFGCIGGVAFGLLGSALNGIIGWAFAGFVGGFIASDILFSGYPTDIIGWGPACILAAVGLAFGYSMRMDSPYLPLTPCLRRYRDEAIPMQGIRPFRIVVGVAAFILGSSFIVHKMTTPANSGNSLFDRADD